MAWRVKATTLSPSRHEIQPRFSHDLHIPALPGRHGNLANVSRCDQGCRRRPLKLGPPPNDAGRHATFLDGVSEAQDEEKDAFGGIQPCPREPRMHGIGVTPTIDEGSAGPDDHGAMDDLALFSADLETRFSVGDDHARPTGDVAVVDVESLKRSGLECGLVEVIDQPHAVEVEELARRGERSLVGHAAAEQARPIGRHRGQAAAQRIAKRGHHVLSWY